jgi:hypothetical protein
VAGAYILANAPIFIGA